MDTINTLYGAAVQRGRTLTSSLQVGMLLVGAIYAGLIGAIVGMGIAMALSHLVLIWLARAHGICGANHVKPHGPGIGRVRIAWLLTELDDPSRQIASHAPDGQ